jgi:hypothetical protein
MSLPEIFPNGFLPPGVYSATLREVLTRFGTDTPRRQVLASRLQELLTLARTTGKLLQTFIWSSFVTAKPFPRDLDVFMLMQQGFDQEFLYLPLPQRDVFTYERAQLLFEADIFWATEASA